MVPPDRAGAARRAVRHPAHLAPPARAAAPQAGDPAELVVVGSARRRARAPRDRGGDRPGDRERAVGVASPPWPRYARMNTATGSISHAGSSTGASARRPSRAPWRRPPRVAAPGGAVGVTRDGAVRLRDGAEEDRAHGPATRVTATASPVGRRGTTARTSTPIGPPQSTPDAGWARTARPVPPAPRARRASPERRSSTQGRSAVGVGGGEARGAAARAAAAHAERTAVSSACRTVRPCPVKRPTSSPAAPGPAVDRPARAPARPPTAQVREPAARGPSRRPGSGTCSTRPPATHRAPGAPDPRTLLDDACGADAVDRWALTAGGGLHVDAQRAALLPVAPSPGAGSAGPAATVAAT